MHSLPFVKVTPAYSGVIDANVDEIWRIVKLWAPSLWIKEIAGVPVYFQVLTGESGEQVGSTRATFFGSGMVVEQLVAVDAEDHYLTWKCISDPRSVNPFPGSFINYVNTLRFKSLTKSTQCLADWSGEFWTDPELVHVMGGLLTDFYQEALQGLEKQIAAEKQAKAPRLEEAPHNKRDSQQYREPPSEIPPDPKCPQALSSIGWQAAQQLSYAVGNSTFLSLPLDRQYICRHLESAANLWRQPPVADCA